MRSGHKEVAETLACDINRRITDVLMHRWDNLAESGVKDIWTSIKAKKEYQYQQSDDHYDNPWPASATNQHGERTMLECKKMRNDVELYAIDDRLCQSCFRKNKEELALAHKRRNTNSWPSHQVRGGGVQSLVLPIQLRDETTTLLSCRHQKKPVRKTSPLDDHHHWSATELQ